MIPRNLTLFRFPTSLDLSDLETALAECTLKPVGPLELSSRGFVSPFGQHGEALSHQVGNTIWITVGGEDKILPGAVVNDLLQKRIAAIQEQEGVRVGGRRRKILKDDLIAELLPRALVRPGRVDAWLNTELGVIAIGTSSRKTAESVVSEIRRALGSFPALPINSEVAPRAVLTGWIAGEVLLEGLSIGDECTLEDPADDGAQVRCTRQELSGEEIGKHLEAGKQATRLALRLNDHVSFVFGEDLVIRKLFLLEGATENTQAPDVDDVAAELDARLALFAGEFADLFKFLQRAFRITAADAERPGGNVGDALDQKRDRILGAATVTLSGPGMAPITMTEGQFKAAATRAASQRETFHFDEPDPLLEQAQLIVRETGKASITSLQRPLKIGYNRAARLIESLEAAGVVSAPSSVGDRTVLPFGGDQ